MAEKARDALIRFYRSAAKRRFIIYGVCIAFFAAYVLKSVIRTGTPDILKPALVFAAFVLIISVLPYYRTRFFSFEYVIELLLLPVFAVMLAVLAVMGFATENEIAGIISCSVIFDMAVYSKKISQHERDF